MLIGQVSTSSQKFQDNLFESNAIPPEFLKRLAEINNRFDGVVERYIYQRFALKQKAILRIMKYLQEISVEEFSLKDFLSLFEEQGLRRSIDKAYEVVVYALFRALLQAIGARVTISVDPQRMEVLKDFEDFTRIVLGVDSQMPSRQVQAQMDRAGVANASDRGLDM